MRNFRRLRSGYSDLGPIQIPPRAVAVVLTDMDNGTQYLVSYNDTLPEHLSLNTSFATIKNRDSVKIYPAGEGPYMDEDGAFMLIVRGGRLGFLYTPRPIGIAGYDSAPPFARRLNTQRELLMDSTDPAHAHIGYNTDG